jgi:hypothetical protein
MVSGLRQPQPLSVPSRPEATNQGAAVSLGWPVELFGLFEYKLKRLLIARSALYGLDGNVHRDAADQVVCINLV